MAKQTDSDTIARLALGLVIFLVMRFAPKAVEAWQKRKDMKGEITLQPRTPSKKAFKCKHESLPS